MRKTAAVPVIRSARARDARALAELAESTFRATFGAMNSAAHMQTHCRALYGEAIQAAEIADPDRETLLCEHDGGLIAYAQLRWGEAPECVVATRPGEIQRLYVADAWHGAGIAQALMQASIERMRQRASDVVWLGVWEHNPRALAFYRKVGFAVAGEHVFPLGGDPQRDLVMVLPLAARGGRSHA
ncbi:GNAT family N-acetyltransferase [Denitratimonas tolerans]|uniref:GNAT family N-acetyltransferase n=1 Tax=Denitratimonas tolerans TaxID=1338420 RepID=A0AAW9R1V0_9GAMM|nr:GNAT family N-acetyltransferase [Xanthomonadaceae bacterium]HRO86747.1 GNAT family N-acetyltransferase [Chiayiivirga sp.]